MNEVQARDLIEQAMRDPQASYWLVGALEAGKDRDPVDAFLDAKRVADLFEERLKASRVELTAVSQESRA